jgi:hypothetical protein
VPPGKPVPDGTLRLVRACDCVVTGATYPTEASSFTSRPRAHFIELFEVVLTLVYTRNWKPPACGALDIRSKISHIAAKGSLPALTGQFWAPTLHLRPSVIHFSPVALSAIRPMRSA